jgi:hypothetical protein
MSSVAQLDQALQQIIRELTLRILKSRWNEFDRICDVTNRICDRHELDPLAPDFSSAFPVRRV